MGEYTDLIEGLRPSTRELGSAIPEAWGGFAKLHASAVADGKLPARVKELMALAIAVVKQCDGCIAYHAKAAARRGATPEEVAEALGVALDGRRHRQRLRAPSLGRLPRVRPSIGRRPGRRLSAKPRGEMAEAGVHRNFSEQPERHCLLPPWTGPGAFTRQRSLVRNP